MLCLCGFELYSRWVPLKDAQFFSFQGRGQLLLRYYRIFKQYTTLSMGLPV